MAVKLRVHEDSTRLAVHSDGTVTFTAEQGFPVYPEMQTKSVQYTPSESAIADTVTPDSGYGGLTEVGVAVDAIPSDYVGSNVPRRSESDLTEEGGTVTAPAGYYSQEASKAVPDLTEAYILDFGRYYVTDDGDRFWKIYAYFQETGGAGGYIQPYRRIDGDEMWFVAIPTGTTVTPREARQTIGGANVMMEGGVTVDAIPSDYVGSRIARRSRDDLSGDYDDGSFWVDGPAGYYANNFSYAVPSGTAGTPTASKGAVSNHAVQVTPSVTNAAGYITGGTKTGTPVTVTAAELVSGNLAITQNGTGIDVAEYASVDVSVSGGTPRTSSDLVVSGATVTAPAGVYASDASKTVASGTAGTPTATKGAVSNHSVSVTPSVTNQTGYITGSTKTGTAVTVSASELVSGSQTVTSNQTVDVTNLAELVINVASSGSAQIATGTFTGNGTRQVTVSCNFEPDFVYWTCDPGTSASSGTVACMIARGMMAANRYRNNSTTNSANIQTPITAMNTGGSSYNFRATYANSTVTLYSFSTAARNLFTNGRVYTYTFIKWT